MKILLPILALLLATPALADEDAALRDAFIKLVADVNAGDVGAIQGGVTAGSQSIVQQVQSENMLQCLKGQGSVNATEISGPLANVRARIDLYGMKQNVKLTYAKENGAWKLDLPATLGGDPTPRIQNAKARIAALRQMMPGISECQILPILIAEAAMKKDAPKP